MANDLLVNPQVALKLTAFGRGQLEIELDVDAFGLFLDGVGQRTPAPDIGATHRAARSHDPVCITFYRSRDTLIIQLRDDDRH